MAATTTSATELDSDAIAAELRCIDKKDPRIFARVWWPLPGVALALYVDETNATWLAFGGEWNAPRGHA